jgi:hypothetical protein
MPAKEIYILALLSNNHTSILKANLASSSSTMVGQLTQDLKFRCLKPTATRSGINSEKDIINQPTVAHW